MKKRVVFTILNIIFTVLFSFGRNNTNRLKTGHIRIRDPFIYADSVNKTYYMYAQSKNRSGSAFTGVEVYTSRDLRNWNRPVPVLTLPEDMGIIAVWAPEMHKYKGKYYLFVTLTFAEKISDKKPVKGSWPEMYKRGTHIFYADSPLGPFVPLKKEPFTPIDWMALDGTLYVEKDTPYMVFCHEWVQTIEGTIDYVKLKADLSNTAGAPRLMFKAGAAPGSVRGANEGKVTDGCFLYRSSISGKLFLTWSTFIPGSGYCVVLAHSASGNIKGPWGKQEIIYKNNGGHAMLFRSFTGGLLMTLHQPNKADKERLHLYNVEDNGKALIVGGELE